jgi:hypothetical protein
VRSSDCCRSRISCRTRPPQLRIEVRQRLVEQEDRGLEHQRARHRDALLLAAGELRRQPVAEARQSEHLELRHRERARLRLVGGRRQRAVADVLQHRHVRKERIRLEHHADVALVRGAQRDVGAADRNAAARHRLEARDHPQRRRLAAARGTQQRHELARRDR